MCLIFRRLAVVGGVVTAGRCDEIEADAAE
jgi:hypothetical protein